MSQRAIYTKRIMAALDRAAAQLHPEEGDPDASVNMSASCILTASQGLRNAEKFDGWNQSDTRAVLLEYAQRGPLDLVHRMAEEADHEIRWWNEWDAVEFYEGRGWTPLFTSEAEARRWS